MEHFDYLIIGGGAAGMAAALAAERKGASVLLVERGERLGGILPQCIHNGFGLGYFSQDLTGPEYAARFVRQVECSSVTVRTNTMALRLDAGRSVLLSGSGGVETVTFGKCVLATGCRERPLSSLPVSGTRPAGIFTAGAAQRLVNLGHYDIGSRIVILGSGDIGQIMARRFTLLGKQVVAMLEIRDKLGGLVRNQKNCIEKYHIPVVLNATVDEVLGSGRISGVMVKHLDTGVRERVDCDTLVTALGLIPERELAQGLENADWLRCCGNCDYVHEIVDTVTTQAENLMRGF